jgi:hypothetical protein
VAPTANHNLSVARSAFRGGIVAYGAVGVVATVIVPRGALQVGVFVVASFLYLFWQDLGLSRFAKKTPSRPARLSSTQVLLLVFSVSVPLVASDPA